MGSKFVVFRQDRSLLPSGRQTFEGYTEVQSFFELQAAFDFVDLLPQGYYFVIERDHGKSWLQRTVGRRTLLRSAHAEQ
jgi:type VI protein secretion system component VasA